jgi:hypothetical protein
MFSCRWHLVAFVTLPVFYIIQAGPHAGYTQTALIPWLNRYKGEYDFTRAPHVDMWISTDAAGTGLTKKAFLVDTGTCGIVVPMENIDIKSGRRLIEHSSGLVAARSSTSAGGLTAGFWFHHDDRANGSQGPS